MLHELSAHTREGKWWIGFPAKPVVVDGTVQRDENGKVRYAPPLVSFTSRQSRDRFTAAALETLRQTQPQLLAGEAVEMSAAAEKAKAAHDLHGHDPGIEQAKKTDTEPQILQIVAALNRDARRAIAKLRPQPKLTRVPFRVSRLMEVPAGARTPEPDRPRGR